MSLMLSLSHALASACGEAVEIVQRPALGAVVRVETTRSSTQSLVDVRMQIAGKPVDLGEEGTSVLGGARRRELVARHLDRVLEVDAGRALRIERRYDALRARSPGADGEAADARPAERVPALLRGRALTLVQAPDGTFTAQALGDGPPLAEELAPGHAPLAVTDAFLPDGPVAVGDHWSAQGSGLAALFQGGGERLFASDTEHTSQDALCDRMWEGAEIVGDIALIAVRERAGLRCAVIEYNLGVLTVLEGVDPVASAVVSEALRGALPPNASMRVGLAGEVQGRLWLALDEGRPVANEAEFEVRFRGTVALSGARSECAIEGRTSETRSTTWTLVDVR
jgi:hypothetical protein